MNDITEKPIKGFDHPLKHSTLDYAQCKCGTECPQMYFNLLSIASRQSGKTYTICKLLKHYQENRLVSKDGTQHPIRIIIISPTISANPIYKSLKVDEKDIFDFYSDELLQEILDDIKLVKEEVAEYKEYVEAYKLVQKTPKNRIEKLLKSNPKILELLEQNDFKNPNELEVRYREIPVNFIVLDDVLASGGFNNKKNSVLTNAIIKNRHLGVCFCILVQNSKGVTKTIRLNSSVFHLGKFANKQTILKDLYEECSNILTEEEFEKLYTYATEERYGSLIIDCSGGNKRFLKGLTSELLLSKSD